MKVLCLVLLGLALITGSAVAVLVSQGDGNRVYMVAEVSAGLHQDPGAWVGRTLRVRGVAEPCEYTLPGSASMCWGGLPVLRSDAGVGQVSSVLLWRGQPDPV